ncbi:YVTN family beta-propeller repeat protein [Streptomyces vinaceus]
MNLFKGQVRETGSAGSVAQAGAGRRTRGPRAGGLLVAVAIAAMTVTPAPPAAALPPGTYTFTANFASDTVSVIDTATDTVTATIPVGDGPFGVAVNVDGTRAYVTNSLDDTVSVIDAATNTVSATIPVGTGPQAVAVRGSRAYTANAASDDMSVIDTVTNTVIATIPVGDAPQGVAVSGTHAYTANANDDTVSVVDTVTGTVTATLPVGDGPRGLAVSGSRAYVTNANADSLSVIDTVTDTVTTTVPVGDNPSGVALSPDGAHAYTANTNSDNVSVIDTATVTVTDTVTVGNGPRGVAVSRDGSRVYASNGLDNSVSVIDTVTNAVTATVAVGNFPRGIATAPVGRPAAPLVSAPSEGATTGAFPKFKGRAVGEGGVVDADQVRILDADGALLQTVGVRQSDGYFSWLRNGSWSPGEYTVRFVAVSGGLESAETVVTFTVAPGPAAPVVTVPAEGAQTGPRPKFTGSAPGASQVLVQDLDNVTIGEVSVRADGYFSWVQATPWEIGPHTARFVAKNSLGLSAPKDVTFVVDVPAPVVNLPAPNTTTGTQPKFVGTAPVRSTVEFYENDVLLGSAHVSSGGNWSWRRTGEMGVRVNWGTGVHHVDVYTVHGGTRSPEHTTVTFTVQ